MILCDICASSCFATFIHDCFIYSLSHLHRFHHILTGTLQPIFSSLSIFFFVLVTPSPYRVLQSTGSLPTDSDVGASLPQTQNQTILALLHPRTPRHVPPSFETPPWSSAQTLGTMAFGGTLATDISTGFGGPLRTEHLSIFIGKLEHDI